MLLLDWDLGFFSKSIKNSGTVAHFHLDLSWINWEDNDHFILEMRLSTDAVECSFGGTVSSIRNISNLDTTDTSSWATHSNKFCFCWLLEEGKNSLEEQDHRNYSDGEVFSKIFGLGFSDMWVYPRNAGIANDDVQNGNNVLSFKDFIVTNGSDSDVLSILMTINLPEVLLGGLKRASTLALLGSRTAAMTVL